MSLNRASGSYEKENILSHLPKCTLNFRKSDSNSDLRFVPECGYQIHLNSLRSKYLILHLHSISLTIMSPSTETQLLLTPPIRSMADRLIMRPCPENAKSKIASGVAVICGGTQRAPRKTNWPFSAFQFSPPHC